MIYNIPVPRPRGHQNSDPLATWNSPVYMNDLFLHALFARLTLSNNENIEFRTVYDPSTNTIELDIPDNALPFLNQIAGIQRGERFKAFINWLIGSETISPTPLADQDPNFIPASILNVWAGATQGNLKDKQLILFLPTNELSVFGYNTKIGNDTTHNSMRVHLTWAFDSGVNTSFTIKTAIRILNITTGNTTDINNINNISTFNLINGDVRETELIDTHGNIQPNNIVSIIVSRNYDGSPDPKTELVGVVGLRIELLDG